MTQGSRHCVRCAIGRSSCCASSSAGRALAAQGRRNGRSGREWVGVAFRLAGEVFLVAREETREVLAYPAAVTRVPGARSWIRGLANVRGQLLPIVDLRAFLGSGVTHAERARRACWS